MALCLGSFIFGSTQSISTPTFCKRTASANQIAESRAIVSPADRLRLSPTDSTVTLTTTTGLGASPSQVTTGDELIAEKSDLFREAIRARNVYAAWARKLTNARPNDPKLQEYHQEVTKAGERVNLLLSQLDVPLFRIPASEKGAGQNSDPIEEQANRSPCCEEPEVENGSGSSPHPRLSPKARSPARPPPPSPTLLPRLLLKTRVWKGEEEEMDSSQPAELQDQVVVPEVIKKAPHPTVFVSPKGDWRQLVALAKLIAPSFQSQMSGRFLKVTVGDELEYRNLSHWLEQSGVEFKSFMLKQDRPIKVVIRGLPPTRSPKT
ncbi:RNA-directed DNA polymerase from mobile element jockey [Trichonephila clavipes]|nr:RNA-directed DNA polymerase from mobile element jockey [Trichonephila clavipes]